MPSEHESVQLSQAKLLAALRDVCAMLYPAEQDTRVVLADAGLEMSRIAFSARAQTNWQNILDEAIRQNRLAAVVAVVRVSYDNNAQLQHVIADYEHFLETGGHFDLTHRTANNDEAPAPGPSPYPGMAYFDVADADRFFGREQLTAELIGLLRSQPLLAVVGASGSGKSSLVRAGLVAALQRGQVRDLTVAMPRGSANWACHIITPTARPLESLAASLTRNSESVSATSTLINDLAGDPRNLHLAISRLLSGTPAERLLLVVDQFEELFTLCRNPDEQRAFIDGLLTAALDYDRTVLVITLRADFYAACARFEKLRNALDHHQKYIGPMHRAELQQAIEAPAAQAEWTLEPGLVQQMLDDVGDEPGALPLLAHALQETWKRRSGHQLTLAGYVAAGGVKGAIAKTADDTYNDFSDSQKIITRAIFLRLTELGEGAQDTRRSIDPAELQLQAIDNEEVRRVLAVLASARLVTTDAHEIQVTHEAVIREWPRLHEWLADDREGQRIHRRLTEAAQEWVRLTRDPGVLYRGIRLEQALTWAAGHSSRLNNLEQMFLDASHTAQREAEAQERRNARFRFNMLTALVILIVVVLAIITVEEGRRAGQVVSAAATIEIRATAEAEQRLAAETAQAIAVTREVEAQTAAMAEANQRQVAETAQAIAVTREAEAQTAAMAEAAQRQVAETAQAIAVTREAEAQTAAIAEAEQRQVAETVQAIAVTREAEAQTAATAEAEQRQAAETAQTEAQKQTRYAEARRLAASNIISRELELVGETVQVGMSIRFGDVYRQLGLFEEAKAQYQRALAIQEENGNQIEHSEALIGIAAIYVTTGKVEDALKNYQQALAIQKESGDQRGEGRTLTGIGDIYAIQGRYEDALLILQQALAIQETISDQAAKGTILSNIAVVYSDLGRYEDALLILKQALAIQEEIGDQTTKGSILSNIAAIYFALAIPQWALEFYQQALVLQKESGDQIGEGRTLTSLGDVYVALGQLEKALESYQQALDIQHNFVGDLSGESVTLNSIGLFYTSQHRYEEALMNFQEALAIQQAIGAQTEQTDTRSNIGFLYEHMGNADEAIRYYQAALEGMDLIGDTIRIEELKTAWGSQQAETYARLIDLLWQKNELEATFQYVERSRARSFLDQMGNQRADFREGADPVLLEQERTLRRQIAGLRNELYTERTKPVDQQTQNLIDRISSDLAKAQKQYEELLIRLKLTSPSYASLVTVNPLSLTQVQKEVLDEETTLVEFFVTDAHTLAWIIDQQGFEVVELKIAQADLTDQVEFLRALIAERDFDADTAAYLYNTLFAPLKPYIHHRNLVIVSHGVLHYLPFAALWNAEAERYLIEDYAITYAPSASVLKFIYDKNNNDQGRLLALGNPDGSLPGTEAEVREIAQFYGTAPFVRRQATESQLYAQAGKIDILHIAAHGVYDPYNPLYSRIELAPDDMNDGYLEVHEIYDLDLSAANLVVLSANETALGAQSDGDEIVGLSRAFLYAGAQSVVSTLWGTEDQSSTELMISFHQHRRSGFSTAEALRAAQVEVLSQEGWNAPYYWAAFTLTGDYR